MAQPRFFAHPAGLGILAAVLATSVGIAGMAMAGAPHTYMVVNAAALALGLLLPIVLGRSTAAAAHAGGFSLAASAGLLATALWGTTLSGMTRWVQIGPLSVQPSLVLLPALVLACARRPGAVGTAAMLVAALALAYQPDRAGAAALAAALVVLAAARRDLRTALTLVAALAGLAVTLLRQDTLAPSRFVEHVFADGFAASMPRGAVLVVAAALLLLPARALPRDEARVFAAVWLALLLASVLGNFPTPLLGYGSSSILGYMLCLAALRSGAQEQPHRQPQSNDDDRHLQRTFGHDG